MLRGRGWQGQDQHSVEEVGAAIVLRCRMPLHRVELHAVACCVQMTLHGSSGRGWWRGLGRLAEGRERCSVIGGQLIVSYKRSQEE